MQLRDCLPSSASSKDSGDTNVISAEPHDVVSCDGAESVVSSFASRVFFQVFSARALDTQPDGSPEELVDSDIIVDNDSDDNFDVDDVISTASGTTASLAPSMSISSIARAEQLLQKSVPFVNGGRHISLTKEDMERVRDKELLRFLEANSAMFVKYLHRRDGNASVESAAPVETKENIDIEQEINDLANRIETFITAFDDDGGEYHICVDEEGKLLVPVGVEDEDALGDTDGYDEDVLGSDRGDKRGIEDAVAFEKISVDIAKAAGTATEKGEDDNNNKCKPTELGEPMEPQSTSRSKKTEVSETPLGRGRLGRRVRVLSPLSQPSPLASSQAPLPRQKEQERLPKKKKTRMITGTKKRPTPVKKQPLPQVRGVSLTAEQDRRIGEIMHTDLLAEPSPYTSSVERLAVLEERLKWLQEVRGPIVNKDNNAIDDDDDDDLSEVAVAESEESLTQPRNEEQQQGQQQKRQTAKELGNAYMREVRQQQLRYARMRKINERLSQLHEALQMETLCPKVGVEQLVGVPRPAWSRDVLPPPDENEIAALLENARRENALALERGEQLTSSSGDRDVSYLQEKLRVALCRVESLVSST